MSNKKAEELRNKSTRELINTISEGEAEPPIYNSGRRAEDLDEGNQSFKSGNSYGGAAVVNGKLTDFTGRDSGNLRQDSVLVSGTQKRKIDEPAVMARWFQGKLYVKIEYAGNIWVRHIEPVEIEGDEIENEKML